MIRTVAARSSAFARLSSSRHESWRCRSLRQFTSTVGPSAHECSGATEGDEESEIREFLRRFEVHPVHEGIAERAVDIRRQEKIRLPDAIIWATAQHLGLLLVTRNTRDFPRNDPG